MHTNEKLLKKLTRILNYEIWLGEEISTVDAINEVVKMSKTSMVLCELELQSGEQFRDTTKSWQEYHRGQYWELDFCEDIIIVSQTGLSK